MIIKTLKQLQREITKLREEGIQTVAVCPGTFRMIHPGHIYLFMRAWNKVAQKNGVVVVLVNSTESVKKIKPEADFIMDDVSRLVMIDLLPCVHYVYMFDETTPEKVCNLIRPDFLFKGADWKTKRPLPEEKYCKKVIVVDRIDRYTSSTALLKKIKRLGSFGCNGKRKIKSLKRG